MTLLPSALAMVAAALLVTAAAYDLVSRTIPNWIALAVAADGIVLRVLTTSARGAVLVATLVFVATFALWLRGFIGGGDAKLIPAVVLLVPPHLAPLLLGAISIIGGVLALIYLALSTVLRSPKPGRRHGLAARLLKAEAWRISHRAGLPYAAAIAGGAVPILFIHLGG